MKTVPFGTNTSVTCWPSVVVSGDPRGRIVSLRALGQRQYDVTLNVVKVDVLPCENRYRRMPDDAPESHVQSAKCTRVLYKNCLQSQSFPADGIQEGQTGNSFIV